MVLIRGVPSGFADRVTEMALEVDSQGQIQRILIDEADGSQTEFVFSGIQENLAVEDARFRFQPPVGVELIEGASVNP